MNLRKIIFEEYNLLLESKRSAYERYVKTGKIVDNVFNLLLKADPSPNKQYIEKMCQFYFD